MQEVMVEELFTLDVLDFVPQSPISRKLDPHASLLHLDPLHFHQQRLYSDFSPSSLSSGFSGGDSGADTDGSTHSRRTSGASDVAVAVEDPHVHMEEYFNPELGDLHVS
jgi:hypothetical protein